MTQVVLTTHARNMLVERDIDEGWVWATIRESDGSETGPDGNLHLWRAVPEREGRLLRVILNASATPQRIVTVFFDRRLGRKR